MIKFIFISIISLLLFFNKVNAQTPNADSLQQLLNGTLHYLGSTQFKADNKRGVKGEWYSGMKLSLGFPLLGKPAEYADANCFTTASLHNELSRIYLSDTVRYSFLKQTINNSYQALQFYKNGNGYNFWREYRVRYPLKKTDTVLLMRQPMSYRLKSRFMKKAANVMNDADDTALGYYAEFLQQKMNDSVASNALLPLLISYRDEQRKTRHWFNIWNKDPKNSGAFMTWLGDEVETRHHSAVHTALHNLVFYLPASKCYPRLSSPYIPYGTNDIDAVVNANVLHALAEKGETDSSRIIGNAAQYITKKIKSGNYKRTTVYYPNRYHLHTSVARAYSSGITELSEAVGLLTADIIKQQRPNGSFKSRKKLNSSDRIQSTANVLYTLLHIGEFEKYKTKPVIEKALHYLLSQMKADPVQGVYWDGGVFFSGGTVVRNILQFKSDANTTVTVSWCLMKMIELKKKNLL